MLPVPVLETGGRFRRLNVIWQAVPAINNTQAEELSPVLVVATLGQQVIMPGRHPGRPSGGRPVNHCSLNCLSLSLSTL
jgi:hypothetical protein